MTTWSTYCSLLLKDPNVKFARAPRNDNEDSLFAAQAASITATGSTLGAKLCSAALPGVPTSTAEFSKLQAQEFLAGVNDPNKFATYGMNINWSTPTKYIYLKTEAPYADANGPVPAVTIGRKVPTTWLSAQTNKTIVTVLTKDGVSPSVVTSHKTVAQELIKKLLEVDEEGQQLEPEEGGGLALDGLPAEEGAGADTDFGPAAGAWAEAAEAADELALALCLAEDEAEPALL
eukprot:tig00021745_g23378.t1